MPKIGDAEILTQNRVVRFFQDRLNYSYLGDLSEQENKNIRENDLLNWLRKRYSETVATRAVAELVKTAANLQGGLYDANKKVYSLLKYGAKISPAPGAPEQTVYFIDWDLNHPEVNDFSIAEEVTVVGNCTKRPDIVVYINGIAVAVLELKKSTISVSNGIRQNLTNQMEHFIQPFFSTIQYCMAGNDSEGLRYGTIMTPEKFYLQWKNFENCSDSNSRAINDVCRTMPCKLDWQLYSIFQQNRLLDLLHNFIIFDKGIKKVCRHNQFFGIKEAQPKVKAHKGGIIWHTQGSGKSLTMVWLSKWILANNSRARVLIVTDREELDDNIEKTYLGVDEQIQRTSSCSDLIQRLNRTDDSLMCSLIHKFGHRRGGEISEYDYAKYIEELKNSLPSGFEAKGDLFVFVDECHRTQSGKLHQAMKTIMPKATFIGFTGTPLMKKDKATSLEVFGGYIHTYKYDEGVADGVVLDLRYEARNIPQEVTAQNKIDEWFEIKTRGLMPRAKARLKQAWGNMQTVFSSRSRLEKIACDIIFDFEIKNRLRDGRGNAILVADSIYSACKYYEIFQQQGFKNCAIISSYEPQSGDLRTDTVSLDEDTETFKKYEIYKKMLNGQDVEAFEKEAKRKFVEEPANMKLLIVVDKLLTGFDAPPCTYLYIDKQMHDHGLFQAVCRVNRLDDDSKDFGYIVDYKELFGDLSDAVDKYTSGAFEDYDEEDVTGLIKNRVIEAKRFFDNVIEQLDELCEGVKPPKHTEDYIHYFCGESGIDLVTDEILCQSREKLYRLISAMIRAYAEIKPDMASAGYSPEEENALAVKTKFYKDLKDTIGRASGDFIDLKVYEPGMRYLIDNYILADESQPLGKFDDFTLLDFILAKGQEMTDDDKDDEVKGGAAEVIENNIRKKIVERRLVNPKYYEKMSAILEKLIEERRRGTISYEELLNKYCQLAKNAATPENNTAYPESIRSNGALRALYDNTGENEELALQLNAAIMRSRQDRFRNNPVKENRIKRELYQILKDQDEVERIFKIIVEQSEY